MFNQNARRRFNLITIIAIVTTFVFVFALVLAHFSNDGQERVATARDIPVVTHAEHHVPAASASVGARLITGSDTVGFCGRASMEPFAGAIQQLREAGAVEAVERFRRCLLDTLFDHAGEDVIADLDTHAAHFVGCYQTLAASVDEDQPSALSTLAQCLSTSS